MLDVKERMNLWQPILSAPNILSDLICGDRQREVELCGVPGKLVDEL